MSLAQWGPVFPSGSLEGLWLRSSAPCSSHCISTSLGRAAHARLMGTINGLLELKDLFIYCFYIYLFIASVKEKIVLTGFSSFHCRNISPSKCTCAGWNRVLTGKLQRCCCYNVIIFHGTFINIIARANKFLQST